MEIQLVGIRGKNKGYFHSNMIDFKDKCLVSCGYKLSTRKLALIIFS